MSWFPWLGRGAEREKAQARLRAIRERYGEHGSRVIKLSARTDLARKSAGSTQRAFDFVERVFAEATQQYATIDEDLQKIEAGLQQGRVGNMDAAEQALEKLATALDELDRQLTVWENLWRQVPRKLENTQGSLTELGLRVDSAAAELGASLPLQERVANMERFLEKASQTLAEGNPVEADHLLDDLRIAMDRLSQEFGRYTSGVAAITQAEQEIADVREKITALSEDGQLESVLKPVEESLSQLRPSLAAGNLETFEHHLLKLQQRLSRTRALTRGGHSSAGS